MIPWGVGVGITYDNGWFWAMIPNANSDVQPIIDPQTMAPAVHPETGEPLEQPLQAHVAGRFLTPGAASGFVAAWLRRN